MLIACLGCTSRPTQEEGGSSALLKVFHELRLTDDTPAKKRPVALRPSDLQTQVERALKTHGLRPVGDVQNLTDSWKVRIRGRFVYGVQVSDGLAEQAIAGQAKLIFKMEAAIRPPNSSEAMYQAFQVSHDEATKAGSENLQIVLRRLMGRTARSAAKLVAVRVEFLAQKPQALLRGVESAKSALRLAAIDRLAMLKYKPAVPVIVSALKTETDIGLRHRLVGALAEIGDDSAARALIDIADTKDRAMLRTILQALSVVGGERVSDFFEILSMHDAADIRDMVENAHRRLKRRNRQTKTRQGKE